MQLNKIKHICFVMGLYPTDRNPANTFVDQLICEIADQGAKCTAIAPQSISKSLVRNTALTEKERIRYTNKGNRIEIFSPKYISYSAKFFLGLNTDALSRYSYKRVVLREYKRRNINADAFYGHFINPSGLTAVELGMLHQKPSFIACGESSLEGLKLIDKLYLEEIFEEISGVIAVSSENKMELLKNYINKDHANKIEVFPNAINNKKFYQKDRTTIRNELGFNEGSFIVVFTGHFMNRKGSRRLSDALKNINDVQSIFIGKGEEEPTCSNILFKGTLPHDQVCKYLNAADVFVLPTLAEGCCNAIIEAMACGLPIISSDRPFNDDILNDENSIRIDPENIEEIKIAIMKLRDNPELRESMSQASLKMAEKLDIKHRAANILEFMNRKAGC